MTYGRAAPRPGPKCLIVNDLRPQKLINYRHPFGFELAEILRFFRDNPPLLRLKVIEYLLCGLQQLTFFWVAVVNFLLRILLFCFMIKCPPPLAGWGCGVFPYTVTSTATFSFSGTRCVSLAK
jgi:hypothetical protein